MANIWPRELRMSVRDCDGFVSYIMKLKPEPDSKLSFKV